MGGVYDSAIAQDYWASRYDCHGFVTKKDTFDQNNINLNKFWDCHANEQNPKIRLHEIQHDSI